MLYDANRNMDERFVGNADSRIEPADSLPVLEIADQALMNEA